jgi:hypothetical protein
MHHWYAYCVEYSTQYYDFCVEYSTQYVFYFFYFEFIFYLLRRIFDAILWCLRRIFDAIRFFISFIFNLFFIYCVEYSTQICLLRRLFDAISAARVFASIVFDANFRRNSDRFDANRTYSTQNFRRKSPVFLVVAVWGRDTATHIHRT